MNKFYQYGINKKGNDFYISEDSQPDLFCFVYNLVDELYKPFYITINKVCYLVIYSYDDAYREGKFNFINSMNINNVKITRF